MELERGVPARLERPEVRHEVWLDPGMLRGDGASDERCWRIRFKFFTVWKTRFGWSLETGLKKNPTEWLLVINPKRSSVNHLWRFLWKYEHLCSSTSGSSIWSSFLMVPSISAARESWESRHDGENFGTVDAGVAVERERELTIGNRPREWKRLVVLDGSDLFRKFFSSSWASWRISRHSAYLSCSSRNWVREGNRLCGLLFLMISY